MIQYYIYKTTNIINNRVYIGQHKSNKNGLVGDKYYGSGKAIKAAFQKYGKKNFKREVLACTSTRESANILEEFFIQEARKVYDCYNIQDGGYGRSCMTDEVKAKIKATKAKNPFDYDDEWKNKMSKGLKEYYKEHDAYWKGKHVPENVRKNLDKTGIRYTEEEKLAMNRKKFPELYKKYDYLLEHQELLNLSARAIGRHLCIGRGTAQRWKKSILNGNK